LTGECVGGLVGVLLVVGGIVFLVILLRKKRKKSTNDRSSEELAVDEQRKTLPTNQAQPHESEIQSQTNTSSHYIPIAKSTAQSQTSQSTQSVELSTKHHIPFEDIEVQKEIGKGSYGKVCLGRWSGTAVALKFCKEKEGLEDFWKEANLMM